MRKSLDGARLKIVRAQEHLDTFKAEASAFLEDKPYGFVSKIDETHWRFTVHLTREPPPRLSMLVGDCLTNIRASLDYIIWQLAQRYFRNGIDLSKPLDRSTLNFPILLSDIKRRQGYLDHLDRLARRGIPEGAIDIIRDVQADAGRDQPGEQLRWLYDLANTDKHRYPILTVGTFTAAQIEIADYRGLHLVLRGSAVHEGVAVKRKTMEPDLVAHITNNPANVGVQAAISITTSDLPMVKAPLDWVLQELIKFAAHLIPRFEPFLANAPAPPHD